MAATYTLDQRSSAAEHPAIILEYEITPSELASLIERGPDRVFVMDIRNPEGYAEGHIPGARNIPLEKLGAVCGELPKDKILVAYCGDIACGAALLAALELVESGFEAKRLNGGFQEWREQGLPIETMPPAPEPEY
jgi:rhodanese-related sulfurtransferase